MYQQYLDRSAQTDLGQLTQVCNTFNSRTKIIEETLRDEMSEWLYSLVLQHYMETTQHQSCEEPPYAPKKITSSKTGKMLITYNVVKDFPLALQRIAMVYMLDCLTYLQSHAEQDVTCNV